MYVEWLYIYMCVCDYIIFASIPLKPLLEDRGVGKEIL
jgi:hypothetical protein